MPPPAGRGAPPCPASAAWRSGRRSAADAAAPPRRPPQCGDGDQGEQPDRAQQVIDVSLYLRGRLSRRRARTKWARSPTSRGRSADITCPARGPNGLGGGDSGMRWRPRHRRCGPGGPCRSRVADPTRGRPVRDGRPGAVSTSRGSRTSTTTTSWRAATGGAAPPRDAALDMAGRVQHVGHDDPQARRRVPSSQHRDRLGQAERGCAVRGVGGCALLRWAAIRRPGAAQVSPDVSRKPNQPVARASVSSPTAPATVVARSAFSVAAVPKAILGVWSSSNQCRARARPGSANVRSRARAVTFQSIRRTSVAGGVARQLLGVTARAEADAGRGRPAAARRAAAHREVQTAERVQRTAATALLMRRAPPARGGPHGAGARCRGWCR